MKQVAAGGSGGAAERSERLLGAECDRPQPRPEVGLLRDVEVMKEANESNYEDRDAPNCHVFG